MELAEPLSKLLEGGILGAVSVISIVVAGIAVRGWLKEKDKRIQDAQTVTSKLIDPIKSLQTTLNNMHTLLQVIANNKK